MTSGDNPESSPVQELPSSSGIPTVYPNWASNQACSSATESFTITPPGLFCSSIASRTQGHAYMWRPQMVPPYGTPPFVALFTPGGSIYPHSSVPVGYHVYNPFPPASANRSNEASVPVAVEAEKDVNSDESKERTLLKRSKGTFGSLSMITIEDNENGQAPDVSATDAQSQYAESDSEGSTERSNANYHNGSQQKQHDEHGSVDEETQHGSISVRTSEAKQHDSISSVVKHRTSHISISPGAIAEPSTDLNIGMDYWGQPSTSVPTAALPSTSNAVSQGIPSDLRFQDQKVLKIEKRKQSNRDAARRSRLRKLAEQREMAEYTKNLKDENCSLKREVELLREECHKLLSENVTLRGQLREYVDKESRENELGSRAAG